MARLPGWRNKLLHVFAPPGWTPLDGTPEAPPPLRFEAATFRRFETVSTGWQQAYGVLACGITLLLLVHWLVLGAALPVHLRAAYGAVIILNVTCIGWVLASARRALVLEAARAVAVFGALAAGLWFGPVAPWAQALAAAGLVASLALLWQVHRTGTPSLGAEGGQA